MVRNCIIKKIKKKMTQPLQITADFNVKKIVRIYNVINIIIIIISVMYIVIIIIIIV